VENRFFLLVCTSSFTPVLCVFNFFLSRRVENKKRIKIIKDTKTKGKYNKKRL